MEIIIKEGGIWEFKEFVIDTDYILNNYDTPCRHTRDGIQKAVVIAKNEAGFNNTGVCLECIIEASKDIL